MMMVEYSSETMEVLIPSLHKFYQKLYNHLASAIRQIKYMKKQKDLKRSNKTKTISNHRHPKC